MSSQTLAGKKVAILATDGFEYSELADPRRMLEQAGATTEVVSIGDATQIKGWKGHNWADPVAVDKALSATSADHYDALLLPGGVMNPDTLRANEHAVAFVRAFGEAGKPIAAICHGPWTLINAGLVKGKTVTSWPTLRADLSNAGATWVDREVVHDGNLITSRKPDDIPAFGKTLIAALGG